MVAEPAGVVSGYIAGWDCYACGVNQPAGAPVYYVEELESGEALSGYRCEDCCRRLGLLW